MHRAALAAILMLSGCSQSHADPATWQPTAGHVQIPIWPGQVPDASENAKPESLRDGATAMNVSVPTVTVYSPVHQSGNGAAVVVFPGGGYQVLAMDVEGTEICDWLTGRGVTCILLKYRVPNSGPTNKDGERFYPKVQTALQDAQRTLGLVRQNASRWHINPKKVGVIGFSAGGHLVAAVSTHFYQRSYPLVDDADRLSSRPDFAIALYPGHLWAREDDDYASRIDTDLSLRSDIQVRKDSPPTFLLQAENDDVDNVRESLTYYIALQKAGVPAELHVYSQGGHAFGLRHPHMPIGRWPSLVEQWMQSIGMLEP